MAGTPPQQVRHLLIAGRVQGVGFRWFARERARRRGLRGWVQNRPEGTVEIMVGGNPGVLSDFLADLDRGPAGSQVESVQDAGAIDSLPSADSLPYPFQIIKLLPS